MRGSIKPGMAIAAAGLWLAIAGIFVVAAADAADGRLVTAQVASAVSALPTYEAGLQAGGDHSRGSARSRCGFGEGRLLKRLFTAPDHFEGECRHP